MQNKDALDCFENHEKQNVSRKGDMEVLNIRTWDVGMVKYDTTLAKLAQRRKPENHTPSADEIWYRYDGRAENAARGELSSQ